MTHRVFSRNASSSRAIPVQKIIQDIIDDPYVPIYWGKNKPGMQATEEMTSEEAAEARTMWLIARDAAVSSARHLNAVGLHKQEVNRLLEPFSHISVIITASEFGNFFHLRRHKDAHPVIQRLADAMYEAMTNSRPRQVKISGWHLPYVTEEERAQYDVEHCKRISVARCARVSYNNHDGSTPDVQKDLELHDRLRESLHMSAFEHQATPLLHASSTNSNFKGWQQYRYEIHNQNRPGYPGI
jgi:thymidylate synthase ThyX